MKTIISTVVALLALAGPLKATLWTTPEYREVSLSSGVNTTLNLPQFDTGLGTLVGVNIEYGISFSGITVTLNNLGSSPVTGTATFTAQFQTFTSTANWGNIPTSLHGMVIGGTDYGAIGDRAGVFDFSSSQYYSSISPYSSVSWVPGTITRTVSDTVSSSLSGYQGTGNFSATLNETDVEGATLGGSGNTFTGNTTTSLFFGTVSYNYISAVPEPGTWISGSMLLIFVGGTVGRSYWRRVKAKA